MTELSNNLFCGYTLIDKNVDAAQEEFTSTDAGKLFNFPGLNGLDICVKTHRSILCPKSDDTYVFEHDRLFPLMMVSGLIKRVRDGLTARPEYMATIVTGPTGSGKTSLFREFAARTGMDLYYHACTEMTEEADLKGSFQLALPTDESGKVVGNTPIMKWSYAEAMLAFMNGGYLVLDEVNALPKGILGFLNHLTETEYIQIQQTREVIRRHRNFRVFAAGNAINGENAASYSGIRRMNISMLDRFMKLNMGYLTDNDEGDSVWDVFAQPTSVSTTSAQAASGVSIQGLHAEGTVILNAYPQIKPQLAEEMVEVAVKFREMFRAGNISAPLTTRGLRSWASLIMASRHRTKDENGKIVPVMTAQLLYQTLKLVSLNILPEDERNAVTQYICVKWAHLQSEPFTLKPV